VHERLRMADSPKYDVMDGQNHVFGDQDMLVCDGSMLSANLGLNPSPTIKALTEHAMSFIPKKANLEATPLARTPRDYAALA